MYRIKWLLLVASFVVCATVATNSTVWAQANNPEMVAPGRVTTGMIEYRNHCAACHGPNGKGDGPVAAVLAKKPADLTQITKGHAGTFPEAWVRNFINGTDMIPAHGTSEMPIWGMEFARGRPGIAKRTQQDVDKRISLLTDYIKSIQEK